ncbi:MAG: hypothetical protein JRD93_15255 [Deltaproteobacteria bacterium]|nr:hypothetical protein [Deltaproteobacteria bacterium]
MNFTADAERRWILTNDEGRHQANGQQPGEMTVFPARQAMVLFQIVRSDLEINKTLSVLAPWRFKIKLCTLCTNVP